MKPPKGVSTPPANHSLIKICPALTDWAMRMAQSVNAGQIFINEWFAGGVETPFGGFKKSGYGREKGREALMNYVQTKNIGIRIG